MTDTETEQLTAEDNKKFIDAVEAFLSDHVNSMCQAFNLESVDVHVLVRAKPEGDDPGNIIFHVGTADLSDPNLIPAIMNTDMSRERKVGNASDK